MTTSQPQQIDQQLIRAALKGQYRAALETLTVAVEQCPDDLWTAPHDVAPFWQVAFHALFFTHYYLQRDKDSLQRWEHHRGQVQDLACRGGEPYTRADILAYARFIDERLDADIEAMDLTAAECGFPWYPLPKLDHQLVNIRHIQHHAAQLGDRVRAATGRGLDWVGGRREAG